MKDKGKIETRDTNPPKYQVTLPGWLMHEEQIGVGSAIKRFTSRVGVRACAGCERRAEALDHWLVFSHKGNR